MQSFRKLSAFVASKKRSAPILGASITALCNAANVCDYGGLTVKYGVPRFSRLRIIQKQGLSVTVSPQPQEQHDDPFELCKEDIKNLYADIQENLGRNISVPGVEQLVDLSRYYFDGHGKAVRPVIVSLMSRAANVHQRSSDMLPLFQDEFYRQRPPEVAISSSLSSQQQPSAPAADGSLVEGQRTLILIAEMIHVASLLHDDVIDGADLRRGKPSANPVWGDKKTILGGDFVLARSAEMLGRVGCVCTNNFIAQILVDLVNGELMQLEDQANFGERFQHYVEKSYCKTASLIAYMCKSTAALAFGTCATPTTYSPSTATLNGKNCRRRNASTSQPIFGKMSSACQPVAATALCAMQRNESARAVLDAAYQYGRNVGIAFQLIDDVLDFVADSNMLGKPAAFDLRLGLSTGPVLFACEEFPELNDLIIRRFSQNGDIDRAFSLVQRSSGLERTRDVARAYANAAVTAIQDWVESPYKRCLISLAEKIITRNK